METRQPLLTDTSKPKAEIGYSIQPDGSLAPIDECLMQAGLVTDAIERAVEETKSSTNPSRLLCGPLAQAVAEIYAELDLKMKEFDPKLALNLSRAPGYMNPEIQQRLLDLGPMREVIMARASRVRAERDRSLASIADSLPRPQQMPRGLLTEPNRFYWQTQIRGCVRTMSQIILSHTIDSYIPSLVMEKICFPDEEDDDGYYRFLGSRYLETLSRRHVSTYSFVGADINWLAKATAAIAKKQPDSQILAVTNLRSDSTPQSATDGAWHVNLLLYSQEDKVIVHDANRYSGGPFRELPIDSFLNRWSATGFRGHLVVSQPAG